MKRRYQQIVLDCPATVDARLSNDSWVQFSEPQNHDLAMTWIQEHERMLASLCRRYAYSTAYEYDDLYQEAVLAVWLAFGTYNDHRVDVKDTTYYWTVAETRILEIIRRGSAQKRNPSRYMEFIEGIFLQRGAVYQRVQRKGVSNDEEGWDKQEFLVDRSPEELIAEDDSYRELLARIALLPQKERTVLMYHVNGYTQKEIAKIINSSQASVSGYLKNAKNVLKQYLKEVA